MSKQGKSGVLELADASGWETSLTKTSVERSDAGQFFTPHDIAEFLAEWFSGDGLNRPAVHLLDPGAGAGVLTTAVASRIAMLKSRGDLPLLREVHLNAWELDKTFLPVLRQNLFASAEVLESEGVKVFVSVRNEDFIESMVISLSTDLFRADEAPRITHAILNPPYRKITSASRERRLLASVGIEVSNLYAAFVALSLRRMEDGGEMAAITPRSFCNGPYFRDFRRELLTNATFRNVHLFDSRSEAFGRDKVLQENVLFHLVAGPGAPSRYVNLTTGRLKEAKPTKIPHGQFVSTSDPDSVIHLPSESDADEIRSFFEALPCRLTDLNIEISTGPVVDFRLRDSLSDVRCQGSVPLIYPHCVKVDGVLAPPRQSADFADTRLAKKAVAIRENDETRRWLLQVDRFVLIKRFSSKEEKRRLVSGVLEPIDFPDGLVGIENHVNFFHRRRAGLSEHFARGLSRFLNSTVADRYFRQFNGHTQVNATDLRAFRYPSQRALERIGAEILDDTCQSEIDGCMVRILGAPCNNHA